MINNRINAVKDAKHNVLNHPMCLELKETGHHFIVIYPKGFRLDGVRIEKVNGKAATLNKLLTYMEKHWMGEI